MAGNQQEPPEPIVITFVLRSPDFAGIAVKHNGDVVWRDDTSVSTWDQYFKFRAPQGVPVVLRVEERQTG